jgi:hypothetical protein
MGPKQNQAGFPRWPASAVRVAFVGAFCDASGGLLVTVVLVAKAGAEGATRANVGATGANGTRQRDKS